MPCDEPGTAVIGLNSIGSREFRAEFYALNARVDNGLSLDRRPDAISYDYLTAYSLGPIQLGDFSAGPIDRPWAVRAAGNQIYASRQNDARDGFDDETLVFQFTGVPPTEIDAAFDQSAHILVCMERPTGVSGAPEVWIYYFDPFSASYQLVNFGRGRTPRAVLDDAVDASNADILVFYLADDTGMCWRQQRERYLVERLVTDVIPSVPDTSLLTMKGPVSFTYIYPPDAFAGFENYPIRASIPFPFTGPPVSSVGFYPYDPLFPIESAFGTLRLVEDPVTGRTYYPFTSWHGIIQDGIFHDLGTINATRDYGAIISLPETAYYAEVQLWNSFFGGAQMRALDASGAVVDTWHFSPTGDVSGTRQLGYVASPLGFVRVEMLPSAQDTTSWGAFRYSTDQLPGVTLPAPLDLPNTFLEDVYRSTSGRIVVIYSVHDPVTGKYTLGTKASVLYPTILPPDKWTVFKTVPLSGGVPKVLRYLMELGMVDPLGNPPDAFLDQDNWKVVHTVPLSGVLLDLVLHHTLYDVDTWKAVHTEPTSGILQVVLIFHTLYDVDTWKVVHTQPSSGILIVVLIIHTLYDVDTWKVTHTLPVSAGSTLV
jgi:hypothetical protein